MGVFYFPPRYQTEGGRQYSAADSPPLGGYPVWIGLGKEEPGYPHLALMPASVFLLKDLQVKISFSALFDRYREGPQILLG